MAPIPEATFFVTFSIWPLQSSLSSMVTPSDFAVVTWLTSKLLIANVGDSVRALSLCLDPFTCLNVEKKPYTNAAVSNCWNYLWLLIDFRFADFRMIRISTFLFSVFPAFSISVVLVNLHLTLQSRLNRRCSRGCSTEISNF